jgi:hypothetical protein
MVNSYDDGSGGNNDTTPTKPEPISFRTTSLFPFQNNSNWWMYSEAGGNSLRIAVTDTISDDNVMYYRVSFQELRVDTTDDWFRQTSGGTLFGSSLTGSYQRFLPSIINAARDTFSSNGSSVTYTWNKTFKSNGTEFHDVLSLSYSSSIIHGFDEIILADSIGIVKLVDRNSRWTVEYMLDSCSIDGEVRRW